MGVFTNVTVTWCVSSVQETATYKEAIQKVRSSNGKYTALVDNWYAEYMINKPVCELAMIGVFGKEDSCIAVSKEGGMKKRLDKAISEMIKSGDFDAIKKKWWPKQCASASVTHRATFVTFVTIVVILELSVTSLY